MKTRTYKTALGRAFGEIPGGIGFLVVIFLFCGGGGAFCFFVTVMAWKDELVGVSIGMLLFGLLCIATPVLISFAAINQDKHPRFSKFVIGDMKAWGKPNRKKAKPKTEDEEDA